MKHIKLFEQNTLDNILDKMGKEEELTKWEQDFLNVYGTPEADKMEEDKEKIVDIKKNVDDKTYEDGKIDIIWDKLDDIDMEEFITTFKIMPEFENKPWHKLPDTVREKFDEFIKQKGYK